MPAISRDVFKNIRKIHIETTKAVNDVFSGAYRSAFKGRGMEFEEVREYEEGDEVRSIDWNVTARMNSPYIKVFKEERELTVMLVVDVSASSRFGSRDRLKSELIAEIGAVLALSAIKNDDKVGLILFSSIIEKYIPPKKGVRHVVRVIRDLLAFQPKALGTNIALALSFLGKVHRRRAACFLVSDFIASDYSKEAAFIAGKHDLISVCMTDPYETSFPPLNLVTFSDSETGSIQTIDTSDRGREDRFQVRTAQRLTDTKSLMKKIGAGFIHIPTDKPYATALSHFFKQRENRR